MNNSASKLSSHDQTQEVAVPGKKNRPVLKVNNTTIQDLALEELDPHIKSQLDILTVSWFSSLSFNAGYCYPPAKRVFIQQSEDGKIIAAMYQRVHRTWLWKQVDLAGPMLITGCSLRSLLALSNADIITISLLTAEQAARLCGTESGTFKERVGEDIVIDLPDNPDIYLKSLGRKTRKHLPYYFRRLEREFGGKLSNIIAQREQISYDLFSSLLSLNRSRQLGKGIISGWEPGITAHRFPMFQESGLFFGYSVENRLICGTLSVIYNCEAILILIGHDPIYNYLDAGLICLWKTIEYMIGMGINRLDMLWGGDPYKIQIGGTEHAMYRVTIFRKRMIVFVWAMYLVKSSRSALIKIVKAIGLDKVRGKMWRLRNWIQGIKKEI